MLYLKGTVCITFFYFKGTVSLVSNEAPKYLRLLAKANPNNPQARAQTMSRILPDITKYTITIKNIYIKSVLSIHWSGQYNKFHVQTRFFDVLSCFLPLLHVYVSKGDKGVNVLLNCSDRSLYSLVQLAEGNF